MQTEILASELPPCLSCVFGRFFLIVLLLRVWDLMQAGHLAVEYSFSYTVMDQDAVGLASEYLCRKNTIIDTFGIWNSCATIFPDLR